MDKFEQKELKKIRPIKITWHDWLINYLPEPTRKSVGGFKDHIVSLFYKNTPKPTVNWKRKTLSKPKKESKIKNPFILKRKKRKIG